ncbi:hypothetical protein ACFQY4_14830 [Catellatospora bangladeshensis]|uniref:Secreted protein n=1 Tax=Catellatospora bangladeshensis TaxID=310355 RepID=A0A8J3NJJ0_9ACTN|nr:hypothetical protein [Catellatospora bangladeshensis]GIF83112.1 hypothetical protein Cba03nite_44610 [Catellatospora bangladeshensis]
MRVRNALGRGLGLVALAAGTVVGVTASPAAAAPDCIVIKDISYYSGVIYAEADWFCYSTGQSTPWPVAIQRQDASGTWVTLASGTGSAAYACVGTTTRTYRTGSTVKDRSVTAPCG